MNDHQVLASTNFRLPGQTEFYKGKVRDVYTIGNDILVMVVSDRISAFDVILPRAIPFKGQVLNQLAAKNMKAAKDVVPNWILDVPDPNVTIGKKCVPLKVEMVIRGYLAGHAWRTYASGKRELCGVRIPDGLKENDKLPEPIITPTTKASEGHDEDISKEDIIRTGIVSEEDYHLLENYTRNLFELGSRIADSRGLILVDTKYEFGKYRGEITLIDEIHTPDSSRYFYADGYAERQSAGEPQRQLSKEFLRQWLIGNGFQGKEGQQMPVMGDEIVQMVSGRYIELFEKLSGEGFQRAETTDIFARVEGNILKALTTLSV
jgi:phosphoribosylaminoimidazole-succinocarboxamide synthase